MAVTREKVRALKNGHWDCWGCGKEITIGDLWEDGPENTKQHVRCPR